MFTNILRFLKTDKKARYQGYTFYFREGLCWNNILNPEARLLKVRVKEPSVNDVGGMSLYPYNDVSTKYLIALLNSNVLFDYYREFINCSVNIQINDIKQLPILIVDNVRASEIELLVEKIISAKKDNNNETELDIEEKLDDIVSTLYMI